MQLLIEKVLILKSVAIFAETPEASLAEVASLLKTVSLQQGGVIFEKGAMGTALYVVVNGSVEVFDGEHRISVLGPRSVFGELSALDPEPRSASVRALEDTVLFQLDQSALEGLMAENPDVSRSVIKLLCKRLRASA